MSTAMAEQVEELAVGVEGATPVFFRRLPSDRGKPIEEFSVKTDSPNLTAVCRVWAGYYSPHPGPLFAEMARDWTGWKEPKTWRSIEGEFSDHLHAR
jgi:hypothetical protein